MRHNPSMWILGLLALFFMFGCSHSGGYADEAIVAPYDWSHAGPASSLYAVKVNGDSVYVGEFLGEHFAHFAVSARVEVEVTLLRGVAGPCTISPKRLGIRSRVVGNRVLFMIETPGAYVVRVRKRGGRRLRPEAFLLLFADPLEKPPARIGQPGVLNVMDFGADGTGQTEATAAIEKAIRAAPKGGTVVFPKGVYRVRGVRVRRGNVRLYLAPGALVRSPERYDGHGSLSPALRLEKVDHVTIEGRGMIEGNGWALRPVECNYLTIRGLIIRSTALTDQGPEAGGRALVPWRCDHLHIDNVKAMTSIGTTLDGRFVKGKDGLNLDSCNHCLVENCFSISGDDTFCAKANAAEEKDITYRNDVAITPTNAIKIGTGNRYGVSGMTWENIDIVYGSIRFTDSRRVAMGNVCLRNIWVEDYNNVFFCVGRVWRVNAPRMLKSDLNVAVDNLTVCRVLRNAPGLIVDLDPSKARVRVTFENVRVGGKPILSVEDLRSLGFGTIVSGLNGDDLLSFVAARRE